MVEHGEVTAERIHDHSPGFLHDEHAAEVVPDTVRVGAHVDETVERAAGNRTDVERRGAHRGNWRQP